MENIVKELKKFIKFKDTTAPGDVVLVAVENPQSVFYAVITDISRDEGKRDEWWHCKMTVLSVPPQEMVWTLREAQFTGKEIFSMGNDGRFMQAIDLQVNNLEDAESVKVPKSSKTAGKTKKGKAKGTVLRVVK